MGLHSAIIDGVQQRLMTVLPGPGDDWWYRSVTEPTASGEEIDEQTALTCAAVFAAVRVLGETVASLPLEVFERLPNGGKRSAPEHPMYPVLHDEFNPEMSSFIGRETMQGHLGTWGNGYAEIERTRGGRPLALWPLAPSRIRPYRSKDDDGIYYKYTQPTGSVARIPARDMLHVPALGYDGLVGYSPVSLMAEPIGLNKAAERYAAELFSNDARPSGTIEVPMALSDQAYKRMQKSVETSGAVHGQRHRLKILEEGAKFASTSMKPEDVQMIEARRFGIEDIARAYRLAPHLLQDLTHGTFSNITELGREFIVFTMLPWFKRWQGEINRRLLSPPYFCEFNAHAFLQGDHKARAEYYRGLFQVAGITPNRILELENENPIGPAGDVRFVPMNMVPLEKAIEGPPKESSPPKTPPPEGQQNKPVQNDNNAAKAFWAEAQDRMLRKEALAAKRWAREPKTFLRKVDEFYEKHAQTCREAFAGPVKAGFRPGRGQSVEDEIESLVRGHIADSREALCRAAECRPAELPGRVADCVRDWTHKGDTHGQAK